ncbi:MAG: ferritin family protein [Candidatus Electryoneaceae bacterium]|nr:ferritin family protein [Candidatus Electryoneaceae bacterium]
MTIEEAIISALDYERKVRDYYFQAADSTDDPKGKDIFNALAEEEQGHVDYLESRLVRWRKNGRLDVVELASTLPSRQWIEEGQAVMQKVKAKRDYSNEIRMLKSALKLEEEVSEHYRKLVDALKDEAQSMFRRFMVIEDAHTAIVQAEIDALEGNGFWFDFAEFNLEMG